MNAPPSRPGRKPARSELWQALHACRDAFMPVIGFSLVINLLMFVSPLYMLQVYDRVISTGSGETLAMVTLIAAIALAAYGFFEFIRSRLLVRAGIKLNRLLTERVFAAVFKSAVRRGGDAAGGQALRDLDGLREFLSGGGIIAFCDAPWVPIFIGVCFLFHWSLGTLALVGALIIFGLALSNEIFTQKSLRSASGTMVRSNAFITASLRNAEVLEAMGMLGEVRRRWHRHHASALSHQATSSDTAGAILAASKFVRLTLQMAVLGLGAYLAIQQITSPGVMIAASIVMGRALAPVEMAVGQWRNFINARASYSRLRELLTAIPAEEERLALPPPQGQVSVQGLAVIPPGSQVPVLRGLSFDLNPGEVVGVIGPSAAGKSSLARVLVGVWPPAAGAVRLDGAEISQWSSEQLGPHIGYLPQDVELFEGSVAENIARFSEQPDSEAVLAAAKQAGVHDMIVHLADGYNTQIGLGGQVLSGGQRQRIGLARALYGDPAIIVLDEPNANLDSDGEQALAQCLRALKDAGRTVLVISHRPSLLNAVDRILVLRSGQLEMLGPRDEVLARFAKPAVVAGKSTQPGEDPPAQLAQG